MVYNSYVAVAIPIALLQTAQVVSRTLDPSSGGGYAFKPRATDASGATWAVYGSPVMQTTYESLTMLQTQPSELLAVIEADIAARWAAQSAPTLADVTSFCNVVKFSRDFGALLTANNLTLVVAKQP